MTLIWCEDAQRIQVRHCRAGSEGLKPPLVVLAELEGCLGAPHSAVEQHETPRCEQYPLLAAGSRQPLEGACDAEYLGLGRSVLRPVIVSDEVAVPDWVETMTIGCSGFADVEITPGSPQRTIMVPRGRALEITAILDENQDSDDEEAAGTKDPLVEVKLELHQNSGTYSASVQAEIGKQSTLGRVPLGEYDLKITGKGVATLVDTFFLTESASPLQLSYRLAPGYCVTVPVACSGCSSERALSFELYQLNDHKPPVEWGTGSMRLSPAGKDRWEGEICDLAPARYELMLQATGYSPVSRLLEAGGPPLVEPLQLTPGVSSWIDVISEEGLPVTGADVTLSWRVRGSSQRAVLSSDDEGRVVLPALAPDTQFHISVGHERYLTSLADGIPGDHLLVILREIGAITASLTGIDCDRASEAVTVKLRWVAVSGDFSGQETVHPDACQLSLPVKHTGTYQLSISGVDFIPYHRELQLEGGSGIDLGEIELSSGEVLRVEVMHRGNPVPGAEIRVSDDGPAKRSDDAGVVELPILDEERDTVALIVSHPDYAPQHLVVDVRETDEVVIELRRCGAITGLVVTESGIPSVGETVFARGSSQYEATVDGEGRYRFPCLDPGPWRVMRLQIGGDGYYQSVMGTGDTRDTTVLEAETVELDFLPAVEVQGRVYLNGEPVTDVSIGADLRSSREQRTAATMLYVDELGIFHGKLPLPGQWSFWYKRLHYTAEIRSCPCTVDLFFTTGPGDAPAAPELRGDKHVGDSKSVKALTKVQLEVAGGVPLS